MVGLRGVFFIVAPLQLFLGLIHQSFVPVLGYGGGLLRGLSLQQPLSHLELLPELLLQLSELLHAPSGFVLLLQSTRLEAFSQERVQEVGLVRFYLYRVSVGRLGKTERF